jgi:hypothetical protein
MAFEKMCRNTNLGFATIDGCRTNGAAQNRRGYIIELLKICGAPSFSPYRLLITVSLITDY